MCLLSILAFPQISFCFCCQLLYFLRFLFVVVPNCCSSLSFYLFLLPIVVFPQVSMRWCCCCCQLLYFLMFLLVPATNSVFPCVFICFLHWPSMLSVVFPQIFISFWCQLMYFLMFLFVLAANCCNYFLWCYLFLIPSAVFSLSLYLLFLPSLISSYEKMVVAARCCF